MKTILVTFAVLLFLLTLLGSFGGAIRTNEPFFDAVPAVKEEGLLRGPTMINQINDVLNMATNGTAPKFQPPAVAPEMYEDYPTSAPPTYTTEKFYEEAGPYPNAPVSMPTTETFYQDEKIDMYVPEPFENDTDVAAASPF